MTSNSPNKLKTPIPPLDNQVPENTIRFHYGLPGFESLTNFEIISSDDIAPFEILQSVDERRVSLIVLNIRYMPVHNAIRDVLIDVNVLAPESLLNYDIYVILKIGPDKKRLTANLKAPIVIDKKHMTGRQQVLDREDLPVDYQLSKQ